MEPLCGGLVAYKGPVDDRNELKNSLASCGPTRSDQFEKYASSRGIIDE
jgi:hypothetical protein